MRRFGPLILLLLALAGLALFLVMRWYFGGDSGSNTLIARFLRQPETRAGLMNAGYSACPGAPFILPSEGLIGLLYADTARPYTVTRRHTGLDIFGDGTSGTVPIVAAYPGWLTRLEDWRSTVAIRHEDPLEAGRTIWTYYTHMASRDGETSYIADDFPPGTRERFVAQGTLLGYQGEFAGNAPPIAMHLHFSIVLADAAGIFLNEAVLSNTLDPTPYLGMALAIDANPERPIPCLTN